jgi:hypothetical protein
VQRELSSDAGSFAGAERPVKSARPGRRLLLLGDVFAFNMDTPSRSAIAPAAKLGPIYELKALGSRVSAATPGTCAL